MEDLLFYTITEGQEMVTFSQFISVSHQRVLDSFALHAADCLDSPPHMWSCTQTPFAMQRCCVSSSYDMGGLYTGGHDRNLSSGWTQDQV